MSEKTIKRATKLTQSRLLAAIAVLTVSYLLIGGLGGAGLYWAINALPNCTTRIALGRAVAFAGCMLVIHVAGYQLWKRQFAPYRQDGNPLTLAVYRPPMKVALLQQGVCLILALLVLDGGVTVSSTIIALIAYWISALLIVARRLDLPTRTDLVFVRYGFFLIWVFVVVAGPILWTYMATFNPRH